MCHSFGAFSLLDTATMSLREARSSSLHREALDTSMPDKLLDLIMWEAWLLADSLTFHVLLA